MQIPTNSRIDHLHWLNISYMFCGLFFGLTASCSADVADASRTAESAEPVAVEMQSLKLTAAGTNAADYQLFSDGAALQAAAPAATLLPINLVAPQNLSVAGHAGTSTLVLVGAESAAVIAAMVNASSTATSVSASARTIAVLAANNTGHFTFELTAANVVAAMVEVDIVNTADLVPVADAINMQTAQTGIVARAQGAVVTLTSDAGYDIGIAGVTDGAAGFLSVAAYDYDGAAGAFSPTTVSLTAGTGSTRLAGRLSLASRHLFTVSTDAAGSLFSAAVNTSAHSSRH